MQGINGGYVTLPRSHAVVQPLLHKKTHERKEVKQNMENYQGITYLRNKLANKKHRVRTRYALYEMKYSVRDLGISTPKQLRNVISVNGWCSKAVDTLADRLSFKRFEKDDFKMNEIFALNNADIFFDSAILSALISSCCFVYISEDEDGNPRLQVIDGENATGIIDPITNLLTEGYAVLDVDSKGVISKEAYFTGDETVIYEYGEIVDVFDNPTGYPLLVPIIYKPDARRQFGHSRISRACISYVESAVRTVKRSEISAEFYSFPQKWVTGLSNDAEQLDKWQASMSAMMSFGKDEDGDTVKLGQFTQQSMSPHNDQLKMFAALFAGETGLTLDDLGFVTDNPSSSEAIKASHENLRLMARKAQKNFGVCFKNVGFVASCLANQTHFLRSEIANVKCVWEPIFEPDASTLGAIGDGIIKINQGLPGFVTEKTIENLTGIEK